MCTLKRVPTDFRRVGGGKGLFLTTCFLNSIQQRSKWAKEKRVSTHPMREPIYSQSPIWTAGWRSNLQAGFVREPTAQIPGAMNKPPPSSDIEGSLQSHADVLQDSWLKYSRPHFSNVAICFSPAQTREEKYVLFHTKSECTAHTVDLSWTELVWCYVGLNLEN